LKLSDLADAPAEALRQAGALASGFASPTVRLGVTGLSRAGKTVFITAFVRSLVAGGRLPFFKAYAGGRIVRAYLEPQPDDSLPRFSYEDHLAALSSTPPRWPDSTRQISQLRVTIEYRPTSALRRAFGAALGADAAIAKLHVDIVDYPGEWLIDLALLDQTYAQWSDQALAAVRTPQRAEAAAAFLTFSSGLDPVTVAGEPAAIAGAAHFTAYMAETRRRERLAGS
jgi:uncharacterized protein